jgi:hypothetical protein
VSIKEMPLTVCTACDKLGELQSMLHEGQIEPSKVLPIIRWAKYQ